MNGEDPRIICFLEGEKGGGHRGEIPGMVPIPAPGDKGKRWRYTVCNYYHIVR